ncbi:unnamed protein product [Urochloa humidicola]
MTLSMKLVIDKKTQRLLFAEASKEVVDFLFSFLAIPFATAVKLLEKDAVLGSVWQPLLQRRQARRHLRPGRRHQGRAPLPHRPLVRQLSSRPAGSEDPVRVH